MTSGKAERFPCPICGRALEVRESKKEKPYLICDPCGMQMFVRSSGGIREFARLIEQGESGNIWQRMDRLEQKYRKECPECGRRFWMSDKLVKTSFMDGRLIGYQCPEKGCRGIAKAEGE